MHAIVSAQTTLLLLVTILIVAVVSVVAYVSLQSGTPVPTPQITSTPTQALSPTFPSSASPTNPVATSSSAPKTSPLPVPVVSSARNWGGYVVASDLVNPQPTVTGVSGSWTVPAVTDIGIDTFSAVWIGVGGQFDQTLIQTGTEQDAIGGILQYSAWYEMLPNDSVTIDSITVSPGDQMQANISLVDSKSNLWSLLIEDSTTGQKFEHIFTYASAQLSAEWIVERPEVNNVLSSLADFGSVTFTNCQVVFTDQKGAINDFPSSKIIMDTIIRFNEQVQLVDVSPLSPNGMSFTVTYTA